MFDTRLPRSISFCAGEIQRMVSQLRGEYRLRNAQRAFDRVQRFQADLRKVPTNAICSPGCTASMTGFSGN